MIAAPAFAQDAPVRALGVFRYSSTEPNARNARLLHVQSRACGGSTRPER